jgi:micrococcal nuclease
MLLPALVAVGLVLSQSAAIDGDTLRDGEERYRVENIDAPERGRRADCREERLLAEAASAYVEAWIAQAEQVEALPSGRRDRYGRVVARIRIDGVDLGDRLIARGLAQPWRGRRANFCSGAWLTPIAAN